MPFSAQFGKILRITLDRNGGRWLLARVAEQLSKITGHGVRQVTYRDSLWITQTSSGSIVDSNLSFTATPEIFCKEAEINWASGYRPKAKDTVIDIGAGVGTDIGFFSHCVGSGGRVIAIEAHPVTFRCLTETCRHNDYHNVECHHLAIMDKSGSVHIDSPDSHLGASVVNSGGGYSVEGMSMDQFIAKHSLNKIDLIKINIEGAERLALMGMEATLKNTEHLCISCHDFKAKQTNDAFFATKQFVTRFLQDRGFSVTHRQSKIPYLNDQVIACRCQPN